MQWMWRELGELGVIKDHLVRTLTKTQQPELEFFMSRNLFFQTCLFFAVF